MNRDLQKLIKDTIAHAPRAFLQELVERKVREVGIRLPAEAIQSVVEALMAGETEVTWDNGGAPDVRITITDEDVEEFEQHVDVFLKEDLPKAVESALRHAAQSLVKTLKKNWPEQSLWENQTHA